MKDVYKIYNFKFDKDKAIECLRRALIEKGLDNKHKFVDFVLKHYPEKSPSTLEEYYTRRLCNDNEILKLLHDDLKINLQEAMLPNSTCKYKVEFEDPTIEGRYALQILSLIDIVFYNSDGLNKDSSNEEFGRYFDELNQLTIIYCHYNYLIQKNDNSYLSSREKSILDLYEKSPLKSRKIEGKKHYLLDYVKMFDIVQDNKLVDLLCVIPPKEKNILFTIYKKLNNEKMLAALKNFEVKELNGIEIINNNLIDTLNSLLDKGVL